eukprot:175222-Pleurochrysis_carterae.AAC.1
MENGMVQVELRTFRLRSRLRCRLCRARAPVQVNKLRAQLNAQAEQSRRIASDATREYLLLDTRETRNAAGGSARKSA